MFVRQPALESLAVSSGDILLLLISLNRPMVALEDYATDEADATICTVRRESDMVSTVVHLLLQQGRTALFYTFESDPYPEDLRGPVEEEAVDFVESLGFIMDDTRFAGIGPDDQKALLERPLFTGALVESPPGGGAETVFEVPPDPAFQFEPMTQERLDAIVPAPEPEAAAAPVQRPAAPVPPPAEESFPVVLAEASLQEMEIVLDDVFQDSRPPEAPSAAAAGSARDARSEAAPVGASSLSRFRRKTAAADLYRIHGIGGAEPVPGAAGAVPSAQDPPAAPAASAPGLPSPPDPPRSLQPIISGPEPREAGEARPAEAAPTDPEIRRRRARARFLASF